MSVMKAEFAITRPYRTDRRTARRWVLSHVRGHGWLVPVVLIGAIGNAALAGVVPGFVGAAFDAIDTMDDSTAALAEVARLAWLVLLSQVLRSFLQLARNAGSELFGQRVERDVRDELYGSLLGKSMAFHGAQPVGDTMARATNDVREVNLMFNPGLNLVLGSSFFLIMPVVFSWGIAPQLILAPTLFVIAYAFALRHYLRQLAPITKDAREAFGRMNTRLTAAIDGIEVVKSASQEAGEMKRFGAEATDYRNAFVRQGEREARFLPLLLLGLALAGGFAHASWMYLDGGFGISAGDIVGYVLLLSLFGFPTFISLFAYAQVSLGMASARRILDLINRETLLDENPDGRDERIEGRIDLEGARFGYRPESPVLEDLSFSIPAGQTVAIVGQTGSGKSTLARLVNRTFDVDAGRVLVDGVDVRDWALGPLRSQIAVIEQEPFLFSRTIAENIAFGRPEASQEEIEAAARAAQAHDFILEQPEGYETVIGERGVTLSGGQRQRLAIARALLSEPRILVLDDSTSAIDSATEDRIQRAMVGAAQGRTTLLITHRLSQIRAADQVIVLRGGRVEACGPHDELMETCPPYRRLFVRLEPGRSEDATGSPNGAAPGEAEGDDAGAGGGA